MLTSLKSHHEATIWKLDSEDRVISKPTSGDTDDAVHNADRCRRRAV